MDVEAILMRSPWFVRQPPSLRRAIATRGRVVRLGAGQWVYGEGDDATGLCAVLTGALRLEATAPGDRDVLIDIAQPVRVFGQSRRRGGGPRIVTARAGPPSTVLLASDALLERIAAEEPATWRAMSELVYAQLDASVHLLAHLLVLPPRERVLARLRVLAVEGVARVAQGDLAELCGLSRKSVNAHLAALEAAGVVRRGYGVVEVSGAGAG